MIALWLAPAVISLLLLAAHFLRAGNGLFMLASLGLVGLAGVRRPWARRVLQAVLVLAAIEWVRVLLVRVEQRLAVGEDWERLAVILASVGLLAIVSAAMLEAQRVQEHFTGHQAQTVGEEPSEPR